MKFLVLIDTNIGECISLLLSAILLSFFPMLKLVLTLVSSFSLAPYIYFCSVCFSSFPRKVLGQSYFKVLCNQISPGWIASLFEPHIRVAYHLISWFFTDNLPWHFLAEFSNSVGFACIYVLDIKSLAVVTLFWLIIKILLIEEAFGNLYILLCCMVHTWKNSSNHFQVSYFRIETSLFGPFRG